MQFKQAIQSGFKKYVTFAGHAARSEYWYWMLFVLLASLVLNIADQVIFHVPVENNKALHPLSTLFSLLTFLPGLSMAVRRLHDTDRSGWWFLIVFIPIIGIIVFLVWACTKGTAGDNRFGPDPLR